MGSLAGALAEIGLGDLLPAELAAEHLLGACEDNGYLAEDGPAAAWSTFWSGWCGGLAAPRELPDFLFEEEDSGSDLVKPTLEEAVYHFEGACDLRRAMGGEFVARPRDPDKYYSPSDPWGLVAFA